MKNYLLLVSLLYPFCGWAQSTVETPWLSQGQVQVGVGVGAGWGSDIGGYLRAAPYAQYLLKNNWAVRLEGRYNYNGPGGDRYAGVGLTTQYHFLRTKRLSVFAQAGYFYGKTDYGLYRSIVETPTSFRFERYREQFNYGMFNVGIGAQYQLGSRWSINALAEKNMGQKVGRFGADNYNTTLGIGFRIK